ncbi:DUF2607 family protein [Vibrio ostreicida]|nr:DUF2607 family protein [Vibrio ostreicida]
MDDNLKRRKTLFAVCGVILILWINFAYIDHQYPSSLANHSEHHCQLFACAHHGILTAPLLIENTSLPDLFFKGIQYKFSTSSPPAYLARSPPKA